MTSLWRPSKTALAVALVIGMLVALYVRWDALCRWFEARRTCAQLRSGTHGLYVFYFSGRIDSYGPPLEPGVYRITITGDCYHSDCDLEIRPGGPGLDAMGYSTPTCRGEQQLQLVVNTRDVIGFMVPLERIHVRMLRDQKLYYQGAPQGAVCILPLAR